VLVAVPEETDHTAECQNPIKNEPLLFGNRLFEKSETVEKRAITYLTFLPRFTRIRLRISKPARCLRDSMGLFRACSSGQVGQKLQQTAHHLKAHILRFRISPHTWCHARQSMRTTDLKFAEIFIPTQNFRSMSLRSWQLPRTHTLVQKMRMTFF
jgi:hypothetical protein